MTRKFIRIERRIIDPDEISNMYEWDNGTSIDVHYKNGRESTFHNKAVFLNTLIKAGYIQIGELHEIK